MLRIRNLAPLIGLLILGLPGVPGNAASRPAADKPQETFRDSSTITLIEVPVNVVDRDGNPVRGLQAEDFELWDEGSNQAIDSVETIDLTTFTPSRAQAERAARSLPSSARRRFLLLFDFTFSNPNSLVRARSAAHDFVIDGLHPTDLAAVATFSVEQGTRLLVTFTSDRAQLARAIDTLGITELQQKGFLDPLRFFYEPPEVIALEDLAAGSGDNFEAGSALSEHLVSIMLEREKAERNYARNRISTWTRSLGDLAKALGSLDGRKNIVLFTEGFDGSLVFGRDASRNLTDTQNDQQLIQRGQFWLVDQDNTFGNNAIQNQLKDMLEEFRRADSLLQIVDLGGLRTEVSTAGLERNSEAPRLRDNIDALFYLADSTGGTLFEQTNDIGIKLNDLLDRSTVTYVLSFYPKNLKADGSFRKLRVKLRKNAGPRGARLAYRTGYYAPKPYAELHPLERSLLAAEAIQTLSPKKEIPLRLLAAPFRTGGPKAYVPVILEIEGKGLLAGLSGNKAGLEIYVYASTLAGEMRDFRTQVLNIDLERQRAAIERRGIKYYAHLDLPAGEFQLRVMIRNSETGKTSVASTNLEIPRPDEIKVELLPPFFFDTSGDWLMVREKTKETQPSADENAVIYPFTIQGEPFVPAALPRLERGKKSTFCLIAHQFGQGALALEGRVLNPEGKLQTQANLKLEKRTDTGAETTDKLLASFDPESLATGEYLLEVTLKNTETGLERVTEIPFVVE